MRSQLDALSCRRTLLLFMQIHLRGGLTDEMPTCLVWKKGGDDRGWAATCPSFDVCGSITHSRQTTQITTLGNPPPEGQREAAVENAGQAAYHGAGSGAPASGATEPELGERRWTTKATPVSKFKSTTENCV
ncbi:hypothetical protein A9K55_001457 [Cordyceps militaris]|uniref:Uncharacterized protein n=1 Tax=Cordyceps militaris TaxID=73501 RepID=A0A2H4SQW9_CORMI|nr:hypothetical protein A9K55_001457 [Cordyceps militaris]